MRRGVSPKLLADIRGQLIRIGAVPTVYRNEIATVYALKGKESAGAIAHVLKDNRANRAVNDYAGDGLDALYEDQCRDICGL